MRVTDSLTIDDAVIDERFVRASGPGGQNVNKVATAVELRFDLQAAGLPDDVRERLIAIAGKRVSADGILIIDCRRHRTQAQNREAARERLVTLLRKAATPRAARRPTRPSRAAKEQRLQAKKRRADVKRERRQTWDD